MTLAAVVGYREADLIALVRRYQRCQRTVATAESITGGLLAAVLTSVPRASAVLRGAVVPYATELKVTLAGVDPQLLARYGPVSSHVAAELARGTAQCCQADVGIALTGVAGPEPQDGHLVGTVYLGLWREGQARSWQLPIQPGSREAIRAQAVRSALAAL